MGKYEFDFGSLISGVDKNTVGLKDMVNLIDSLSLNQVIGNNTEAPFSNKATTYLYSGGVTIGDISISAGDIANAFENARTLDQTVAANFLNSDDFNDLLEVAISNDIRNGTLDLSLIEGGLRNPNDLIKLKKIISGTNLNSKDIENVSRIAANGFNYEPTRGAWAIISENFIESTPATSKIQSIVPEANTARTWGQVEVPTMLEKLDDGHKIGDTTVGDLKKLIKKVNGDNNYDDVYKALMHQSSDFTNSSLSRGDSLIHFDSDGKYAGFDLVGRPQIPRDNYYISVKDLKNLDSDKTVQAAFGAEYDKFSTAEKLQAREIYSYVKQISGSNVVPGQDDILIRYLQASNKTVDKLDDVDRTMLNLAYNIGDKTGPAANLSKALSKYKTVAKVGAGALKIISFVGDAKMVIDMGLQVKEAFDQGDTKKSVSMFSRALVTKIGSAVGGTIVNSQIAPYFIGFGAAVAGVPGAVVGAIIGGAIAFGATEKVVEIVYDVSNALGEATYEFINWLIGSVVDEGAREKTESIVAQAAGIQGRVDPLALDLDGDGIETTDVKNGTYFDLDNSGFAEKSAWIKSDDGILVLDRNGNGKIDGGKELFGDQTLLKNGEKATGGFQALEELDDNKDGKIDSADSKYSEIKVWRDLNQDGQSSEEELFSLDELGIKALNLANNNVNSTDANGNIISRTGSYEKTDGSAGTMGEYLLNRSTTDTTNDEWLKVPETLASLPDVMGFGNVHSLRQTMIRDESGELQELVKEFSNEVDISKRNSLMDRILFKWTGSENIAPDSRGNDFDARKLAVLEKFNGRSYVGTGGTNPVPQAVPLLNQAYNELAEKVYAKLMYQTHLKEILGKVKYGFDMELGRITVIGDELRSVVERKMTENPGKETEILSEYSRVAKSAGLMNKQDFISFRNYFADKSEEYAAAIDLSGIGTIVRGSSSNGTGTIADDIISGSSANDSINGDAGNDIIYGKEGNDSIYGGNGNDTLYGGEGDDSLYADAGNDVLTGGAGSDTLTGGEGEDVLDGGEGDDRLYGGREDRYALSGNDTYIFGRGYGRDIIRDTDTTAGNLDVIKMKEDIKPEDILVKRTDNNLELIVKGTSDKLIVEDYFSPYYSYSYNDPTKMVNKVEEVRFTDGTVWDVAYVVEAVRNVNGTNSSETLYGYEDNDIVKSHDGDDTVYSGAGNDTVYAGSGNDYIIGDVGEDNLFGEAGNDTLVGGEGEDVLDGGEGDDRLYGGREDRYALSGNDTYIFGRGYGRDIIRDTDTTAGNLDVIKMKEDIKPEDILVKRTDNNLELIVKGTSDKLIVEDYFSPYYSYSYNDPTKMVNKVEEVRFTDGTVWDVEYVCKAALTTTGSEGSDYITGFNDQDDKISGLAGDDTIYGYAGNDVLTGGAGNDTLAGGEGEDVLDGGEGNDYMEGGVGNDTYTFGGNSGNDVIFENDSTPDNKDKVVFGEEQLKLIFSRSGNDMRISLAETDDTLTIRSWYEGSEHQVEEFKTSDGSIIKNNQVEQLVQAMAAFTEQNGMSWNQAINNRSEEVRNILDQFWTRQEV